MTRRILLLLLAIIGLAIPTAIHQSHASLTGSVYISPPSINSTQYSLGSFFNVTVRISGMDSFSGWDVFVRTNPLVISPVNTTFVGDLFEANYSSTPFLVANCVNGVGVGCRVPAPDGLGIAHSAGEGYFGSPPTGFVPPINGTLFTITYKVTGASGFSRIEIVADTFSTSGGAPVPTTTSPGLYGTARPDFGVYADPSALIVNQGSNATSMITVNSFGGFSGIVNLTVSQELKAVFNEQKLNVTANGSASTQLTIVTSTTTPAYDYPTITVTAYNRTVSRSLYLDVNVKTFPDFLLEVTPSILRIHAGSFANTTIVVQSQNLFSGTVGLTVHVPVNVTYVLGSSQLVVLPGGQSRTNLNITTPIVSLPFVYLINVTGTSSQNPAAGGQFLFHTQALIVKPPSPSFTITINPATITVRAGLTSSVRITVTSVDYFWQYVYLSATMSGGAASFDSNSYYMPLPNSKFANITESVNFTLSVYVPIDQVPGHYIVLLTVYQSPLTQTIGIPVVITSLSSFHSANPTILGLSPTIYFGILGALAIPFIALSVYAHRKAREEEDEDWKA